MNLNVLELFLLVFSILEFRIFVGIRFGVNCMWLLFKFMIVDRVFISFVFLRSGRLISRV